MVIVESAAEVEHSKRETHLIRLHLETSLIVNTVIVTTNLCNKPWHNSIKRYTVVMTCCRGGEVSQR